MSMKDLTHKQSKFVLEYMRTGNATESYKRAGYSASNDNIAGVEGHKLLKHPKISRALAEKRKEFENEAIMDAKEVLAEITKVARGLEEEQVLIGVGNGKQKLTKKEASISDRLKALEMLGRRYALFTDRIDADVDVGAIIIDDVPSDGE